jgi:hypothetical protein
MVSARAASLRPRADFVAEVIIEGGVRIAKGDGVARDCLDLGDEGGGIGPDSNARMEAAVDRV